MAGILTLESSLNFISRKYQSCRQGMRGWSYVHTFMKTHEPLCPFPLRELTEDKIHTHQFSAEGYPFPFKNSSRLYGT
jgi:hypothetical protein